MQFCFQPSVAPRKKNYNLQCAEKNQDWWWCRLKIPDIPHLYPCLGSPGKLQSVNCNLSFSPLATAMWDFLALEQFRIQFHSRWEQRGPLASRHHYSRFLGGSRGRGTAIWQSAVGLAALTLFWIPQFSSFGLFQTKSEPSIQQSILFDQQHGNFALTTGTLPGTAALGQLKMS